MSGAIKGHQGGREDGGNSVCSGWNKSRRDGKTRNTNGERERARIQDTGKEKPDKKNVKKRSNKKAEDFATKASEIEMVSLYITD